MVPEGSARRLGIYRFLEGCLVSGAIAVSREGCLRQACICGDPEQDVQRESDAQT